MNDVFKKAYNEILKRNKESMDFEPSVFGTINECIEIEKPLEGTYKILNEYVKDPNFTPIPKEFLNETCALVNFRKPCIISVSFSHLYELLRKYDYEYFEEFKENLKKRMLFNGNLYVITLLEIDDSRLDAFNSTFNFILAKIDDQDIAENIFMEIMKLKDVEAFCSIANSDVLNSNFFNGNALIYVSLFAEYPKDSLEHELTHFVQRVVGFDKSLKKQFTSSDFNSFTMKDKQKTMKLYSFVKSLSKTKQTSDMLIDFFKLKFNEREFDQSVKAVLNGFQRIYEQNRLDFLDKRLDLDENKKNRAEAKKDMSVRMEWLDDFFDVIENESFKEKCLIPVLNSEMTEDFFKRNRSFFIVVLYLGFKEMFNFNIKDAIIKHFKEFKYKDN